MRFFTRAWCTGELDDEAFDQAVPAYWRHIDAIADRLPPEVLHLAREVSLHDSMFISADLDRRAGSIELKLRCGDRQIGYFNELITYSGATLVSSGPADPAAIINNPETEVLYDEIDLGNRGQFVHRLLCWPQGELTLWFTSLTLSRHAVSSRAFAATNPILTDTDAETEV